MLGFDFSRTLVMGILNLTPDSFSDGGQFEKPDVAFAHIQKMIAEGADIIDIGAESSRPGARAISVEDEIWRLEPIVTAYKKFFSTPLSVDTMKPEVAEFALSNGADMINDISAARDARMLAVAKKWDAPIVLMHMKGEPQTMQQAPDYDDVVSEVVGELKAAAAAAREAGVAKIVVDPGIGFGKSRAHNLKLLRHLGEIKKLGFPVMVGTSRKSFIGGDLAERLEGSIVSAVLSGADIVRVHDVAATKRALAMAEAIRNA